MNREREPTNIRLSYSGLHLTVHVLSAKPPKGMLRAYTCKTNLSQANSRCSFNPSSQKKNTKSISENNYRARQAKYMHVRFRLELRKETIQPEELVGPLPSTYDQHTVDSELFPPPT